MTVRKGSGVVAGLVALMMAGLAFAAPAKDLRWSVARAKAWGNVQPWYCGVNYIPANAINYTAMWDKTSFSPEVIRKELRLASGTATRNLQRSCSPTATSSRSIAIGTAR